jgi:hypothetical protein
MLSGGPVLPRLTINPQFVSINFGSHYHVIFAEVRRLRLLQLGTDACMHNHHMMRMQNDIMTIQNNLQTPLAAASASTTTAIPDPSLVPMTSY